MRNLKRLLLNSGFTFLATGILWGGQMTGGNYVITKDLLGAAGPSGGPTTDNTNYSLAFAWGEPVSGNVTSEPTGYSNISGYFGGGFGNGQTFQILSSQVGTAGAKTFFQEGLQ